MIDDLSDKEQIELFKKWWKQYGWSLLMAILVGLSLGYGWRYWHQSQNNLNVQASELYMQLTSLEKPTDKQGQLIVAKLDKQYQATPYPSFAHLLLAKSAVDDNQLSDALTQLTWVQDHGRVEAFQTLAALRKARVLLAMKDYEKAHALLSTIKGEVYKGQVAMIQGDIYQAEGNIEQARKAYQSAQQALNDLGATDPLLAMKLAQLGQPHTHSGDA